MMNIHIAHIQDFKPVRTDNGDLTLTIKREAYHNLPAQQLAQLLECIITLKSNLSDITCRPYLSPDKEYTGAGMIIDDICDFTNELAELVNKSLMDSKPTNKKEAERKTGAALAYNAFFETPSELLLRCAKLLAEAEQFKH